ncbi:protein of unknown function [Sterolibacterium denitrificans]|uniref:Uncharacterized protein n=1 Tax=Sterolibacterium denitrificans TaxID=157592 RepID=A0A7Z7HPH8_9PROT|nr:protein of unknown function [Sterolibacterium denitrificans]
MPRLRQGASGITGARVYCGVTAPMKSRVTKKLLTWSIFCGYNFLASFGIRHASASLCVQQR